MEWGDNVKAISKDEAVMLVNHQATGDVCTLMMCLQDKGPVSLCLTVGRGGRGGAAGNPPKRLPRVGTQTLTCALVLFLRL